MALDGAAQRLVTFGHDVVVHGRDQQRAQEALRGVPGARSALAGDLASLEQTRALADQANAAGPFQTVIRIRCRTALVSGPVERGQSGVVPTKMGGPQAPDDLGLGCRDAGLVGG